MEHLSKYLDLCESAESTHDPDKIRIFWKAEKWAFEQILRVAPSLAREWLERLEPVAWNNYLTEAEAAAAVAGLMDYTGKTGPVWDPSEVEDLARASGELVSLPPYYNRHALYATVNMLATDHLATLKGYVGNEAPALILKLSLDKLKDIDRPEFVRPYFGL